MPTPDGPVFDGASRVEPCGELVGGVLRLQHVRLQAAVLVAQPRGELLEVRALLADARDAERPEVAAVADEVALRLLQQARGWRERPSSILVACSPLSGNG